MVCHRQLPSDDTVSVVTVTTGRKRTHLLAAVASVQTQHGVPRPEHVVIGDGSTALAGVREALESAGAHPVEIAAPAVPREVSARLAWLRNLGVRLTTGRWIAFLDDDNLWTPDHLASLLQAARSRAAPIAHSHRLVLEENGRPWQQDWFPWPWPGGSDEEAIATLRKAGVLSAGSSVMRDRVRLGNLPGTVDTNEWLLRREVCLAVPWPERLRRDDRAAGLFEDGVWLRRLLGTGLPVACSRRPSLVYQLGGRSSTGARPPRHRRR